MTQTLDQMRIEEVNKLRLQAIKWALESWVTFGREIKKGKAWEITDNDTGIKAGLYHLSLTDWGIDGLQHDDDIGPNFSNYKENFYECISEILGCDFEEDDEIIKWYSHFVSTNKVVDPKLKTLENQGVNTVEGKLKEALIDAINRNSLSFVLATLQDICEEADTNNPNFGWDKDANTLSAAIEKINN